MATIRRAGGGVIKMRLHSLVGRTVRTRRELRTEAVTVPPGTLVKVSGYWRSGVHAEAPACGHCGVAVNLRKINRDDIELVEGC